MVHLRTTLKKEQKLPTFNSSSENIIIIPYGKMRQENITQNKEIFPNGYANPSKGNLTLVLV